MGWRHSYQRMVVSNKGISISSAYVARPDGKVHTYTNYLGVWHGQSDIPNKLNEILDGGGNTTGWSITLDDGSVESYAADGRLLEIRSREGVMQYLIYDSCERLQLVADSFGKALFFTYTENCEPGKAQRIATVTMPGGGVFSYDYDSEGRLTAVLAPDGTVKTYHYENSAFPVALTGITDEQSQRYATFGYDVKGRPNLSELAGGAGRFTVDYLSNATIYVNQADVTNPLGATVHYDFVIKQGVTKVGTQNSYCAGCPSNVKSFTYDTNGNVTRKVDFLNQHLLCV